MEGLLTLRFTYETRFKVKYFSEFNINNHVILGPTNYLGRPISESNIQEYVSNITSKYMPIDLPQWQIVMIPSAGTGDSMVNL